MKRMLAVVGIVVVVLCGVPICGCGVILDPIIDCVNPPDKDLVKSPAGYKVDLTMGDYSPDLAKLDKILGIVEKHYGVSFKKVTFQVRKAPFDYYFQVGGQVKLVRLNGYCDPAGGFIISDPAWRVLPHELAHDILYGRGYKYSSPEQANHKHGIYAEIEKVVAEGMGAAGTRDGPLPTCIHSGVTH